MTDLSRPRRELPGGSVEGVFYPSRGRTPRYVQGELIAPWWPGTRFEGEFHPEGGSPPKVDGQQLEPTELSAYDQERRKKAAILNDEEGHERAAILNELRQLRLRTERVGREWAHHELGQLEDAERRVWDRVASSRGRSYISKRVRLAIQREAIQEMMAISDRKCELQRQLGKEATLEPSYWSLLLREAGRNV